MSSVTLYCDQHPCGELQIAERLNLRRCPGAAPAFLAANAHPALDPIAEVTTFALPRSYIEGWGTWASEDPVIYRERAAEIITLGYSDVTETAITLVQR